MDDLIEALQILRKYGNPEFPTHCEHDTLMVNVSSQGVSDEDLSRLNTLGFFPFDGYGEAMFKSYRFGNC